MSRSHRANALNLNLYSKAPECFASTLLHSRCVCFAGLVKALRMRSTCRIVLYIVYTFTCINMREVRLDTKKCVYTNYTVRPALSHCCVSGLWCDAQLIWHTAWQKRTYTHNNVTYTPWQSPMRTIHVLVVLMYAMYLHIIYVRAYYVLLRDCAALSNWRSLFVCLCLVFKRWHRVWACDVFECVHEIYGEPVRVKRVFLSACRHYQSNNNLTDANSSAILFMFCYQGYYFMLLVTLVPMSNDLSSISENQQFSDCKLKNIIKNHVKNNYVSNWFASPFANI